MDSITVFLAPVLWLLVFGFFFLATIISIIAFIRKKIWKPIIIQVITILILFIFPFNQVIIEMDFMINKQEREKVALMVQSNAIGEEVSSNSHLIQLPEEFRHLSKGGGEIVVENAGDGTSILFFSFRGVMDNFFGIVYALNGRTPDKSGFFGEYKEVEKLDDSWFFVSSY
ncbi:hypothetical protein JMA_08860 [Jeotgalibacillus malaysiensis]|uniref:Uncharacterized protein n=1 Tax=Jeotgalibacillus malaysiensis TaxID=1508404 RepID=A0A0B5ANU0_9BACL|nr:hypothetical protein [Jeotgalibacillus malaysiensis]AJD90203.1 hypothetical protein JMA_08860 [Jeotgalibacillus malaysiensis]